MYVVIKKKKLDLKSENCSSDKDYSTEQFQNRTTKDGSKYVPCQVASGGKRERDKVGKPNRKVSGKKVERDK